MVIHLFQMMSILLQTCSGISCEFCTIRSKNSIEFGCWGFLKDSDSTSSSVSSSSAVSGTLCGVKLTYWHIEDPTLHYLPSKLLIALQLQEVPTCLSILDKGYNTWWCHLSFEFTQTKWCRPLLSKWYNVWLQTSLNVSYKEHSLAVWFFSR